MGRILREKLLEGLKNFLIKFVVFWKNYLLEFIIWLKCCQNSTIFIKNSKENIEVSGVNYQIFRSDSQNQIKSIILIKILVETCFEIVGWIQTLIPKFLTSNFSTIFFYHIRNSKYSN